MSFARVKPGGWALNEKLTSAQQNLLDIDHANALDKTGDTIGAGDVIGVDGQININSGGAFAALSGSSITLGAGSNVQLSPGPGGQLTVGGNTTMTVAVGSNLTVLGSTQLSSAQTETLSTVSLITIDPSVTRTRTCRSYCSGATAPGGGGTPGLYFVTSDILGAGAWLNQTLNGGVPFVLFPLDAPHGSTIQLIRQWIKPPSGHGGIMPETKPRLALIRKNVVVGASIWDPVTEVGGVTAPPVTIGDYEATFELVLSGLSEVIDRHNYVYWLRLTGECGNDSKAGMYASMPQYQISVNKYEDF